MDLTKIVEQIKARNKFSALKNLLEEIVSFESAKRIDNKMVFTNAKTIHGELIKSLFFDVPSVILE